MLQESVKRLIDQGQEMFSRRSSLVSLWQEIAEQFYVERADFTVVRSMGQDFAGHLTTSYPLLARRDLGNSLSAMLRPAGQQWFKMTAGESVKDRDALAWLEWATSVQKRAMYDRLAQFTRATKEGDHDFAAFGQCIISVELNAANTSLLYRTWHLRDVAWCENADGAIGSVYRQWKPTAATLKQLFRDRIHENVSKAIRDSKPHQEFNCYHIVIETSGYEGETKYRTPLVSLFVDIDNQHVMEEVGLRTMPYVIPRWQTVSGSQYAYSPATVCALPDARLIQAMTLTLLEAGEKAANPPMVATKEVIRGDVALFAGGVTWVDQDYDERLGEALRPLTIDKSGMPIGMQLREDVKASLLEAFYLNKLSLPVMAGDMTATEVSQRVQEYIRQAMPLFEPMEIEYNGALCERTFDVLMGAGAFGTPDMLPRALRGRDVQFKFESPLQEASDKKKAQVFMEGKALLAAAADLYPEAARVVNAPEALRDALNGVGFPAAWTHSKEEVDEMVAADAERMRMQEAMAAMAQGAQVAEQFGKASQAIAA